MGVERVLAHCGGLRVCVRKCGCGCGCERCAKEDGVQDWEERCMAQLFVMRALRQDEEIV
jgi:hypothetical protein